jgi:hypothetical protein
MTGHAGRSDDGDQQPDGRGLPCRGSSALILIGWTTRRSSASSAICTRPREEIFFHGTRQALLNHAERMLQLEREYANRFPERTKADALRTRKGARLQAGQPTDR